ncbi:hypothetical protein O9993_11525 [Vibrio lentus]|nr:hypothetical protein [Vibrio lentus]
MSSRAAQVDEIAQVSVKNGASGNRYDGDDHNTSQEISSNASQAADLRAKQAETNAKEAQQIVNAAANSVAGLASEVSEANNCRIKTRR